MKNDSIYVLQMVHPSSDDEYRHSASDLVEDDKASVVSGSRRWPDLFIVRGKGSKLTDSSGRDYVDLTAGGAACNVGHNNEFVVKAICDQAQFLVHVGYQSAPHAAELKLANTLKSISSPNLRDGKVAFTNSGSEAVDVALRISKAYTGNHGFLSYEGSHHGSTLADSWVSGDVGLKKGISPSGLDVTLLPYPYCYRCPLGLKYGECGLACIQYVKRALETKVRPDDVCCLLFEAIQQASGIVVPPDQYFAEIEKLCKHHKIMMVADEVVTGLGRTGRMFAIDHSGTRASVVILGKPLASGMPLGAVIGEKGIMEKAADSIHALESGAANPICCAASQETINLIVDQKLAERAAVLGERVLKRMKDLSSSIDKIGEVRGSGLLIGVELVENRESKEPATELAKRIVRETTKRGVLIEALGLYKSVLRISPPLNIFEEDLSSSLDIVERVLVDLAH